MTAKSPCLRPQAECDAVWAELGRIHFVMGDVDDEVDPLDAELADLQAEAADLRAERDRLQRLVVALNGMLSTAEEVRDSERALADQLNECVCSCYGDKAKEAGAAWRAARPGSGQPEIIEVELP
jgi:chromosome segregation ATPase